MIGLGSPRVDEKAPDQPHRPQTSVSYIGCLGSEPHAPREDGMRQHETRQAYKAHAALGARPQNASVAVVFAQAEEEEG